MTAMSPRCVGLAHSKLRNMFGLVGVSVTPDSLVLVRFAREWKRSEIVGIPADIRRHYDMIKWTHAYADQSTGEHLLNELWRDHSLRFRPYTTQKALRDPEGIHRAIVIDKVEMVQWVLAAIMDRRLLFPKEGTEAIRDLESQMAMFSEHTTEAGGVDYFAVGEEYDSLPKALFGACLGARKCMHTGSKRFMVSKSLSTSRERYEHLGSGLTGHQIPRGKMHVTAGREMRRYKIH